jgi:hypothetical protein
LRGRKWWDERGGAKAVLTYRNALAKVKTKQLRQNLNNNAERYREESQQKFILTYGFLRK